MGGVPVGWVTMAATYSQIVRGNEFFMLYLQFRYICLRLLENKMAKYVCVEGRVMNQRPPPRCPEEARRRNRLL